MIPLVPALDADAADMQKDHAVYTLMLFFSGWILTRGANLQVSSQLQRKSFVFFMYLYIDVDCSGEVRTISVTQLAPTLIRSYVHCDL